MYAANPLAVLSQSWVTCVLNLNQEIPGKTVGHKLRTVGAITRCLAEGLIAEQCQTCQQKA
jgi:hypothetical protein